MRKYEFDWETLLEDSVDARPNLGENVDIDVYRLLQFTLRDAVEQVCGADETDRIFFCAGQIGGRAFYEHCIFSAPNIEEFIHKVQQVMREKGMGILRMEESSFGNSRFMLVLDEDLDCSGLPEMDYETCIYTEGFLSALFESYTQEQWDAKEVDCWCTGARTCRFLVTRKQDTEIE